MSPEECMKLFERYLFGKASNEEIVELKDWCKNNPEFSCWMERQIENTPSNIDALSQYKMFRNIRKKAGLHSESYIKRNGWKMAGVVMLPIFVALVLFFYMPNKNIYHNSPYIIAVEKGQKASTILPDGTKVWLNSQSKLTCITDFNVRRREVELQGEAYFEVAHDKSKPFRVKCGDLSVEALGTAFVVRNYKEDRLISSVLINGRIRVATLRGEIILMPNERIEYDKKTHEKRVEHITNASDFADWRHNEFRFENQSFKEIAKDIERAYNIKLIFGSKDIENMRFTGTVSNSSLESLLNVFALTSSLTFKIEKGEVILRKK